MFFVLPFTMMLSFAKLQGYVEMQLAPEQHNFVRKCDKNVYLCLDSTYSKMGTMGSFL